MMNPSDAAGIAESLRWTAAVVRRYERSDILIRSVGRPGDDVDRRLNSLHFALLQFSEGLRRAPDAPVLELLTAALASTGRPSQTGWHSPGALAHVAIRLLGPVAGEAEDEAFAHAVRGFSARLHFVTLGFVCQLLAPAHEAGAAIRPEAAVARVQWAEAERDWLLALTPADIRGPEYEALVVQLQGLPTPEPGATLAGDQLLRMLAAIPSGVGGA